MKFKIYQELPQEAKKIRTEVFMKEQGFKGEFDEIDKISTHIVIFEDNVPIGTCRLFYSDTEKCYLIGRIAVMKEQRGNQYGSKLLELAEKEISKKGGREVELTAQSRVSSFYEKHGYQAKGDIFYEEGCPHIWMKKSL